MSVLGRSTIDTNIAVYAFTTDVRTARAAAALRASSFLSVQVLNEYVNVGRRKRRDSWSVIDADVADICDAVPTILPIDQDAHKAALRIAGRYGLTFYDALLLAVALAGGAETFYSEDMHHDLVIDDTLRIVDPFR